MSTKFPEIFEALAAEFDPHEVKSRKKSKVGNEVLWYITARTAMNRLDAVLGPENWWPEPVMLSDNSFLCKLSIRLPDGTIVSKSAVGGVAGMSDAGDDDKSGDSDAIKRAAVLWGVGRYLYRDGVPSYAPAPAEAPAPAPAEDFPCKVGAPLETWSRWIGKRLRRANAEWLREMVREGVPPDVRQQHRELSNEYREVNNLVTRLIELGEVPAQAVAKPDKPDARDPARALDVVRGLFERRPRSIKRGVEKHIAERLNEERTELGLPDPDAHDAAEPQTEKVGAA